METESIKSERSTSNRSHKSRNSGVNRSRHRNNNNQSSGKTGSSKNQMAPFQTTVNLLDDTRDSGQFQEVIEVQILPQDDSNWGAETHITGNTSEQSLSMENVNWPNAAEGENYPCQKYFEHTLLFILSFASLISPIAMALLPKLGLFPSTFQNEEINQLTKVQLLECNAECKGTMHFYVFTIIACL